MGTWMIVIEGHGTHHNGREDDADHLSRVVVEMLRDHGHHVARANFIMTGSVEDVATQKPADADSTLAILDTSKMSS